jgi:hypothetical protein
MLIDGKKMYFSAAARNLFRLDPIAKHQTKSDSANAAVVAKGGLNLDAHCQKVIDAVAK